MSQLLKTEN